MHINLNIESFKRQLVNENMLDNPISYRLV